ncbi:MAG: preprotein translocase subunit SecE [Candidatus Aminicenantes bacterium]|nr:preprotein translocase subunit SecE [Candidatus Aminicenantes bacterium]
MAKENIFKRIGNFLGEIKAELKKVTWPSRADIQKTTIAVLISSFIFGVYLYVADVVFYYFFEMVKNIFR